MQPTLKAAGMKLLKPKCGNPLSNFAFNFNLRRYTSALTRLPAAAASFAEFAALETAAARHPLPKGQGQGLTLVHFTAQLELILPIAAQLELTLSPIQPKLIRGCVPKVLKVSSDVSDVSRRSSR
jgi:hypothetical protein